VSKLFNGKNHWRNEFPYNQLNILRDTIMLKHLKITTRYTDSVLSHLGWVKQALLGLLLSF